MSFYTIFIYTLISLLNFSFGSCWENPFQKSKLPQQMPDNFKISYSENGGMAPTWFKIEIDGTKLKITKKGMRDEKAKKSSTEVSIEDMRKLYAVVARNKFDLIKNDKKKEIVYDAGSEGVYIRAGKVSKSFSYGMNSPLSGKNLSRYLAVKKAIRELEKNYKEELKPVNKNFVIFKYDKNIQNSVFEEGNPTTLSETEINRVDDLIKKAVNDYNSSQPKYKQIIDLVTYKRQFIPILNKNKEKVIWANYFCEEPENWITNLVIVSDGGSCFFNLYINLTKDKTEKLDVNGMA